MKKLTTLLFIFFILTHQTFSQEGYPAKPIEFEHCSWNEILSKAAAENKMIFLDGFASWCGPCKWMTTNVFPDGKAGEFYNKHFINAKFDMEKGEGIELAKKYGVKAFPTFIYLNSKGEMLHRTCGSVPVAEFIKNGEDALNPEKQLFTIKKKFEGSKMNAADAMKYFALLDGACMPLENEISGYFQKQSPSKMKSKDNWQIIYSYVTDAGSKEFNFLVKNRKFFYSLAGKDSVDDKIANVHTAALSKFVRKKDEEGFKKYQEKLKKSGEPLSDRIILNSDMNRFQKIKDWENFFATAEKYVPLYGIKDANLLNSLAWTCFENFQDQKRLEIAAGWAMRSIELKPDFANFDTYANLLFKTGKKAEAEAAALKAIEMAKAQQADYSETEALLRKIRE